MTSFTNKVLDEVREKLAPIDSVIKLARDRRGLVLEAAMDFPGTLRSYYSGSIAHGTANFDLDADCGVVLDRRTYPELGPDGDDVGPTDVVVQVADLVKDALPDADVDTSKKRAIMVTFNAPVGAYDPSVDLIVGLERRDEPGLWIPQLFTDTWDASHPEKHTELFTSGSDKLRQIRARAVRLAKGWNGQFEDPCVSSFNIETIAWNCVTDEMTMADALAEIFEYGARELLSPTPDPAEVSPPIKLLLDPAIVVSRFNDASKLMQEALQHDEDENAVREALAKLFPDYVDALPSASADKAAIAAALRDTGNSAFKVGSTGVVASEGAAGLKNVRSWSDEQGR